MADRIERTGFMRPEESKEFQQFREDIIARLGLTWEDWCWLWDKISIKRQLFEPKPKSLMDKKYLTVWIFQYLNRSTKAYNEGALSNQDRAKHIMELVKGQFKDAKTASIVRKLRDKQWSSHLKAKGIDIPLPLWYNDNGGDIDARDRRD